jgi:hypothetical protein
MRTIRTLSVLLALLFISMANFAQPPSGDGFVNPKIDHFWIAIETTINSSLSGGTPVDDPGETGQWALYTQPGRVGVPWYNIWFYNAPLTMTHMKKIRMGFWVMPLVPQNPGQLYYVVNWSTPAWDPVVPGYPTPDDEEFILRSESNGPIPIPPMIPPPGIWQEMYFEIPDYNPEWVSVDIFGLNILISMDIQAPPATSPLFSLWDGGPGGTIVHECLPTGDYDFGDAPEGDTAYIDPVVIGNFPTCIDVGPANSYISHGCPSALFFGAFVDCENDGNAGLCPTFGPNLYNMDECGTFPYPIPPTAPPFGPVDEGLMKPIPLTLGLLQPSFYGYFPCGAQGEQPLGLACKTAVWGQNIDIWLNGVNPQLASPGFFNLLVDWNRDGDWNDVVYCDYTPVSEHVVIDFPIPAGFVGPISALGLPNFIIGPDPGYVWTRFTLTEVPVGPNWGGSGTYNDGETEDYLLKVAPVGVIPVSNWAVLCAAMLMVFFMAFMWWRNR